MKILNLRKSFKGKIKVDKIYTNNINQSNKSSTKLEVAIQTSILNSYNTRNQIKDEYIKNKQYINHNNNILKNSSSTSHSSNTNLTTYLSISSMISIS